MQFNLLNWLFQDPCTATSCATSGAPYPETFHYYPLWIAFCAIGLLISFYYSVEGRKRFTKDRPWVKYMLDRYLGWLAILCIIAIPIIACRAALFDYFFAWRIWRYLWLLGVAIWAALFIVHRFRKYPEERNYYLDLRKRDQYIPKANKRKSKAKASAAR